MGKLQEIIQNKKGKLDVVAHIFNPSTWETEAGGLLGVQGQPGLQRKPKY